MHQPYVTRRMLLRATSASVAAAATASALGSPALAAPAQPVAPPAFAPGSGNRLFRELDEKIRAGMVRYGIPGVAVGVLYRGAEYVKGTASPMSTTRCWSTATPCSGSAPPPRRSPVAP